MSNNIRFIDWHFHIDHSPFRIYISRNNYHKDNNYPDGLFSIYTFLWYDK